MPLSLLARPSKFLASLAALAVAVPAALYAQANRDEIAARVAEWYQTTASKTPGQWGIAVADQSGKIIWSENADEPLMPASTVKLFTTGYARSVLGGGARRSTRVIGQGWVEPAHGEWIGNWALELNGDPSLERPDGAGPTLYDLATQLASSGVRKLTGPLQVRSANGPATAAYPAVWSRRHYGRLFAPPVGPLTVHENVVWFTVEPGARAGKPAQLVDAAPTGVESLVTMNVITRPGSLARLSFRQRADGGWILSGNIGLRAGARRFSAVASNPNLVLTAAWRSALRRAGISWNPSPAIGAPTKGSPRVLAEVASAPFDSLATDINRRSLNLGAELLLQWAGGQQRGPELLTAHVQQVTGQTDGIHFVDGSGLSYDDRATAHAFIAYLAKFPTTSAGRNFPQLLPANGTGTLRRLNSGLPGEGVVRAKTGTLSRASNVVGYLGRPDGVLLLSLMYNGAQPWAARQAEWKLFRLLGANGVVIPADSAQVPMQQLGGDSARAD